jgi:anti-sigma factor RsiW
MVDLTLDGELDVIRLTGFERHLAECRECVASFARKVGRSGH